MVVRGREKSLHRRDWPRRVEREQEQSFGDADARVRKRIVGPLLGKIDAFDDEQIERDDRTGITDWRRRRRRRRRERKARGRDDGKGRRTEVGERDGVSREDCESIDHSFVEF